MRKYDADAAAAFHAAQGAPVTAFDAVHEEVFEKRQKERAGEEVATTRKPFRSKMC